MGCGATTSKKYKADLAAAGGTDAKAAAPVGEAEQATAPKPEDVAAPVVGQARLAQQPDVATTEASDPEKAKCASEASSSSDGSDDQVDEAEFEAQLLRMQNRGARVSISADCSNVVEGWIPPVFEKTPEQEARLRTALAKCFMFSVLDEEQLQVVIRAFQETPLTGGETVIEQGHHVTVTEPALYVIEHGQLSVYKKGIDKKVFTYTVPGQYFGDLALLYNAPRAATVKADVDSLCWSIDRDTFNILVKDAARQQMTKRLEFLAKVPLLTALDRAERMQMCDAMQVRTVQPGAPIIHQGDLGDEFFILEHGRAEARKDGVAVMSYGSADFFGELALIKRAPRAADVVALDSCRLLVVGDETLRRLLGPLDQILKDRAGQYERVNLDKFK